MTQPANKRLVTEAAQTAKLGDYLTTADGNSTIAAAVDGEATRADAAIAAALEPKPDAYRVVSRRGKVGSNQSNGADTTQASRTRWVIQGACGDVRFVFSNFLLPAGQREETNSATITNVLNLTGYTVNFQACLEDPSSPTGSQTGAVIVPIFFNGKRTATMEPNAIVISDPVQVNVAEGGVLWLRCSPTVTSGDKWVNALATSNAATPNFDGGGVGEGVVAGSSTIDSGTIATSSAANVFGPTAILGRPTPATRKPSVLIVGDSIAAETNNVTAGNVSYMTRACMNAGFATTRVSVGGEQMAQILGVSANGTYWRRARLAQHCTDALVNYGTNDIYGVGLSLAQMKTNFLAGWLLLAKIGLRVHQLTILPRATSTDGFMSIGSQSIADPTKEAVRTGFNDWLRDPGVNGAVAQSAGSLASVIDGTVGYEVNSSNTPTTNGGLFKVPAVVGAITGTATGYTTTVITDSSASRTVNGDVGKVLAITSATTGAGQAAVVVANTATSWTLLSAITLPTGTVTYKIGTSYMVDGTHPSETWHTERGDSLSVATIAAP